MIYLPPWLHSPPYLSKPMSATVPSPTAITLCNLAPKSIPL